MGEVWGDGEGRAIKLWACGEPRRAVEGFDRGAVMLMCDARDASGEGSVRRLGERKRGNFLHRIYGFDIPRMVGAFVVLVARAETWAAGG